MTRIGFARIWAFICGFLFGCAILAPKIAHANGIYIEGGTSVGSFSNGDGIAQKSLGSPGLGFVGSLSIYLPVTSLQNPAHFELGIQNRFTTASDSNTGSSVMMFTPNIAARFEFWRFYVGGGYAPKVLIDFKPFQGSTAYFMEGGLIWRVVPELQICATIALEYGVPASGGVSPNPSSEYGLRFRFPLNPNEYASGKGVNFDGFRYPFGVMK